MKLFKNKVGRPSNKTKRNRRIFSAILMALVITLISAASYMLNSIFNTDKLMGLSRAKTVNTPTFEIVGVDTSIKIGDETYNTGEYLETNKIGNDLTNDLVLVPKGKTLGFNGRFPKLFYNGAWKKRFIYKVGAYDNNDNLIGEIKSVVIEKQDNQFNFVINENVKYLKANLFLNIMGYIEYPMLESIVYVANTSDVNKLDINFVDSSRLSLNSKDIFEVPSYGDYSSYAIISNPDKQKLYYRWFTYSTIDASDKKLSYKGDRSDYCVAFNDSKIITKFPLGLGVSKTYPGRSGKVKVYLSSEQCKADNNANDNAAIIEKVVRYKYNSSAKEKPTKFVLTPISNSITNGSNVYEKNKDITISSNPSSTSKYIVNSSSDKLRLSAIFTKNVYNLKDEEKQYVKFIAYDINNNEIEEMSSEVMKVDKEKYSYDFSINDKVKKIKVLVYIKNDNGDLYLITERYVNTDIGKVSIKLEDKNGTKADSNNRITVSKLGSYYVKATITQGSTQTLYYRWDTFNGLNNETWRYSRQKDRCIAFNSNTKTVSDLESLDFNDKNIPRSGRFSVYSNKTDCTNDSKATGNKAIATATIGYKYATTTTTTTSSNTSGGISIKLEDKNGNTADSNNRITVSKLGSYYAKATITQSGTQTLYYRWDTFNGLNNETWRYSRQKDRCIAFNSNTKTVSDLESLDFNDKNIPRSGRFSVYSNKTDCTNDSKATGSKAVATATIGYSYQDISTNKSQYKLVNYNFNEIKSKFGKQAPHECYKASLTYGAWITLGLDRSDIMYNSYPYSRSEWGSNNYAELGAQKDVYSTIINQVNKGKPVVVHGSCKSTYYWSHWVLVVGYKNGINANTAKLSDFIVIDPIEPSEKTLAEALPGGLIGNPENGYENDFMRIWWN